jgi:hypothetical protein
MAQRDERTAGDVLRGATNEFIDACTAALNRLTNADHDPDSVIEASNLVAAIIASDDRQTLAELDAYLDAFATRLDPPLMIDANKLRETGLMNGRATWLDRASTMFDLLARADVKNGTTNSHRYYDAAMRLAHVTASIDLVPSPAEVAAIDTMRTQLLNHLDSLGLHRPGTTPPTTSSGGRPGHTGSTHGAPTPSGPSAAPPSGQPGQPAPATSAAAAPATSSNPTPREPARPINELLAELDALVGLANVKAELRRLTSLLQVQQLRAERGLPTIETSHHLVFTGNPGTGKTTVARLLSQIYRSLAVVTSGHLVETDRSKLVAGFVGQTALKTQQALEASLGGMLLIDEAYALARGGDNDFGREAIDTVVKFMEDHRHDFAVVAAGYPEEMADFIDANPGLKSRFTRTVNFPDYTDAELVQIFTRLAGKNGYTCSDAAMTRLAELVIAEPRGRGFGNARFIRNLFETAVAHQAMRLAPLTDPSNEQLTTLTGADIAPVDA